jgi:hypothetical protein
MRFRHFAWWTALMAGLLAGCASGPRIDWNARIGKYTYEQAVQELGTPDKSPKLADGALVAEWLVRSNAPGTIGYGGEDYLAEPGWVPPERVAGYPGGPDAGRWLRLVFAPDGKLSSWKRYRQP